MAWEEEEEIVMAPGAYWVIVTDSVGCSGVSDTVHFDVFDQQTAEIFTKDSLALCSRRYDSFTNKRKSIS